jgi:hypothetical protein
VNESSKPKPNAVVGSPRRRHKEGDLQSGSLGVSKAPSRTVTCQSHIEAYASETRLSVPSLRTFTAVDHKIERFPFDADRAMLTDDEDLDLAMSAEMPKRDRFRARVALMPGARGRRPGGPVLISKESHGGDTSYSLTTVWRFIPSGTVPYPMKRLWSERLELTSDEIDGGQRIALSRPQYLVRSAW